MQADPEVDDVVGHVSAHRDNVLALAGRHVREVDAANDARDRHREIRLLQIEPATGRRLQFIGPKPLEEFAALIPVMERHELQAIRNVQGTDLHDVSLASRSGRPYGRLRARPR